MPLDTFQRNSIKKWIIENTIIKYDQNKFPSKDLWAESIINDGTVWPIIVQTLRVKEAVWNKYIELMHLTTDPQEFIRDMSGHTSTYEIQYGCYDKVWTSIVQKINTGKIDNLTMACCEKALNTQNIDISTLRNMNHSLAFAEFKDSDNNSYYTTIPGNIKDLFIQLYSKTIVFVSQNNTEGDITLTAADIWNFIREFDNLNYSELQRTPENTYNIIASSINNKHLTLELFLNISPGASDALTSEKIRSIFLVALAQSKITWTDFITLTSESYKAFDSPEIRTQIINTINMGIAMFKDFLNLTYATVETLKSPIAYETIITAIVNGKITFKNFLQMSDYAMQAFTSDIIRPVLIDAINDLIGWENALNLAEPAFCVLRSRAAYNTIKNAININVNGIHEITLEQFLTKMTLPAAQALESDTVSSLLINTIHNGIEWDQVINLSNEAAKVLLSSDALPQILEFLGNDKEAWKRFLNLSGPGASALSDDKERPLLLNAIKNGAITWDQVFKLRYAAYSALRSEAGPAICAALGNDKEAWGKFLNNISIDAADVLDTHGLSAAFCKAISKNAINLDALYNLHFSNHEAMPAYEFQDSIVNSSLGADGRPNPELIYSNVCNFFRLPNNRENEIKEETKNHSNQHNNRM